MEAVTRTVTGDAEGRSKVAHEMFEIGGAMRCLVHWLWLCRRWRHGFLVLHGSDSTPAAIQPGPAGRPHPLDPALRVAQESLRHIRTNVRDYTAIMSKRSRVNGELGEYSHAFVKIRNRHVENGTVTTPCRFT